MEEFKDELECPYCGNICDDEQQDSQEPNKEEYCGACDNQFGYEEEIATILNMDDWENDECGLKEMNSKEIRTYRTYRLD